MKTTGNTILITGGNSGIGKELAREFHKLGNKVIITGRRKDAIDEVLAANPGMDGYVLDVQDEKAIEDFAAMMIRKYPDMNILFNNAGIMKKEDIKGAGISLKDAEDMVITNLLAPIRLTAAFLPHLKKQKESTIINTTSGLAFVPLTVTPTYNATKAALHSYSIALREQLKGTSVEVIELIPPAVQTDLMPGHATNPNALPLQDYINETMALFKLQPTPSEICVERVKFLRNAEVEGRFGQTLTILNAA
ncbi:MAG: oxidoreductase [Micavibrio aeruginosavorus]|uniref:Oxidoreductase n=1 Tax=Micavibrio aeruginosavorus TaxID=349221 RepID=A0A2W5N4Y2_9BACT|nr:MAG: oxidoreductase [Micavibrio aeruginosavorus]